MKPMVMAERERSAASRRPARVHDRRDGETADQVDDERTVGERQLPKSLCCPESDQIPGAGADRAGQANPEKTVPCRVAFLRGAAAC